jgi:hypothetical protein
LPRFDALAWYFDLEKELDTSKLIWVFPVVFALVMLILAVADWLSFHRKAKAN